MPHEPSAPSQPSKDHSQPCSGPLARPLPSPQASASPPRDPLCPQRQPSSFPTQGQGPAVGMAGRGDQSAYQGSCGQRKKCSHQSHQPQTGARQPQCQSRPQPGEEPGVSRPGWGRTHHLCLTCKPKACLSLSPTARQPPGRYKTNSTRIHDTCQVWWQDTCAHHDTHVCTHTL